MIIAAEPAISAEELADLDTPIPCDTFQRTEEVPESIRPEDVHRLFRRRCFRPAGWRVRVKCPGCKLDRTAFMCVYCFVSLRKRGVTCMDCGSLMIWTKTL